jgi:hypothetical protein
MIIPAIGSESTVVKTDETGKIQGENKDGETLLSFIREVRQILEIPAIQNMIQLKTPQKQQQQTQDETEKQGAPTENESQGLDASVLMEMLSTKKGCIQFAQGLDTVIGTFGDKKLSEFRDMILDQAGVKISEYQALTKDLTEKTEIKKDETKLN